MTSATHATLLEHCPACHLMKTWQTYIQLHILQYRKVMMQLAYITCSFAHNTPNMVQSMPFERSCKMLRCTTHSDSTLTQRHSLSCMRQGMQETRYTVTQSTAAKHDHPEITGVCHVQDASRRAKKNINDQEINKGCPVCPHEATLNGADTCMHGDAQVCRLYHHFKCLTPEPPIRTFQPGAGRLRCSSDDQEALEQPFYDGRGGSIELASKKDAVGIRCGRLVRRSAPQVRMTLTLLIGFSSIQIHVVNPRPVHATGCPESAHCERQK